MFFIFCKIWKIFQWCTKKVLSASTFLGKGVWIYLYLPKYYNSCLWITFSCLNNFLGFDNTRMFGDYGFALVLFSLRATIYSMESLGEECAITLQWLIHIHYQETYIFLVIWLEKICRISPPWQWHSRMLASEIF